MHEKSAKKHFELVLNNNEIGSQSLHNVSALSGLPKIIIIIHILVFNIDPNTEKEIAKKAKSTCFIIVSLQQQILV